MNKITIYLLLTLLVGCGYFDNDGVIYEKQIVGNFKISRQENSSEFRLIFSETPSVSSVMIQDCKKVIYDSLRKNIYIESELNKYNFIYYEIHILNPRTSSSIESSRKREINKTAFDSLSNNLPLVFNALAPVL